MEVKRKRVKVVMLATEDKASIAIGKITNSLFYSGNVIETPSLMDGRYKFQHLHFTSDGEIEEGEYGIYDGKVVKVLSIDRYEYQIYSKNVVCGYVRIDSCKKIIATTDSRLITQDCQKIMCTGDCCPKQLARPSKSFIEAYCKKGGIDEVDVEYVKFGANLIEGQEYFLNTDGWEIPITQSKGIYLAEVLCESNGVKTLNAKVLIDKKEDRQILCDKHSLYLNNPYQPKVNSHNEITTHRIKDNWNREEMESKLFELAEHYAMTSTKFEVDDFNKWIKQNL